MKTIIVIGLAALILIAGFIVLKQTSGKEEGAFVGGKELIEAWIEGNI